MKVFIGADHKGFELKNKLRGWLNEQNYETEDLGAQNYDPGDDYPLIAEKVAKHVSAISGRGIVICGSGVGVDIVANKIDNIRAGYGASPEQIKSSREDDDINILAISSEFTDIEKAKELTRVFLETEFSNEERKIRRIEEIGKIEDEQ